MRRMAVCLWMILFVSNLAAYERPPQVSLEVWESLVPHFLPEDHPLKPKLDAMFNRSRIIGSCKALKAAGFTLKQSSMKTGQRPYVAKHSSFKDYLLKIYNDEQMISGEWEQWRSRILGSLYIQQAIDQYGYQKLFSVPKKWIYPLPPSSGTPGPLPKSFILVVENMKILKREENLMRWRSIAITPALLKALHTMLQSVGLLDSVFPDNIPFTKKGKIAFVDTQHFHKWPVPFNRLMPFLFIEVRPYWAEVSNSP